MALRAREFTVSRRRNAIRPRTGVIVSAFAAFSFDAQPIAATVEREPMTAAAVRVEGKQTSERENGGPIACGGFEGEPRRDTVAGGASIRLRIHNNAAVETATLTAATKRVDFVYSNIRIRTRWTMMEPVTDDGMPLFDLVIARSHDPASKPSDVARADGLIGKAAVDGHRAYAFFDRVTSAAAAYKSFQADLLADVIAHEIGHLVLGVHHRHALSGVMRADILRKAGLPRHFSSAEGHAIRRRVLQGHIGRPVVNVQPCGRPAWRIPRFTS
jgi:hypothetical protein